MHDEGLELGVVAGARRHCDGTAARQPDEVARYIVANDADHLADDGDSNVVVRAALDLDQLLRVAADVLVQAEEIEVGVFIGHVLDLKDAAGAFRVITECRCFVQPQIGGDNSISALGVGFARCAAVAALRGSRTRRRFSLALRLRSRGCSPELRDVQPGAGGPARGPLERSHADCASAPLASH